MKLILIDGSSLLTTSFFGNVPRDYYQLRSQEEREAYLRKKALRTEVGIYTNAVYPMTRILLNLIERQKPTHLAVAWDVSRNTFRRQLYSDYKGHREDALPILGEQYGTMQALLETMNISQFWFEDYEADDILGTLARKFEQDMPVYIYTKDQDALQLISRGTRVWLLTSKADALYQSRGLEVKQLSVPDGTFEYTTVTFEEEYGLEPWQMIDKKALEGDSSDNIPGVKGVGEKASVPLLREFGTIDNLYEYIEDLYPAHESELKQMFKDLGIARSPLSYLLKESETELVGKRAALLSKDLATIRTDLQELALVDAAQLELKIDYAQTREKFLELEFNSLLKKLPTAEPTGDDVAV
ncbi:5'-3' exonuclease [Alicyclobacillus fastidiosus]|uniref:5'-3' exonuclease n=1 Tax=Alicyclobacillus fastidiosus TaxID=392011 RepID=A0ABV5AC93_9BACL|nr:5'-3' exonuclease H3TH domain-containing protein [Alicyclobacillus fastidiosus]WEH10357.1 5'-3' exonuclease H3TH domain-containing protein [Alicyclobacillus fastidiosus]